jgi:hypothetical protein
VGEDEKRQSRPPHNDSFAGALDDLFGSDDPDPLPVADPIQERDPAYPSNTPQQRPDVAASHRAQQPQPQPHSGEPTAAPPRGRSAGRIAAIGCAALLGISVACFTVLMIIGLLVGDNTSASSSSTVATASTDSLLIPPSTPVPAATVAPTVQSTGQIIPLNTFGPISSQWRVAVVGSIPDATAAVLERNSLNSEPDEGRQYFIATVSVRNIGRDADVFPATLLFRADGDSGYEYSTFDDFCGVIPDAYPNEPIAPGETVTANVCWSVLQEDVASLVMRSTKFSGGYEEQTFALRD